MRKALTFDDVCLVPRYTNIDSRTEPVLGTKLTRNLHMGIPLIPANMDTVISPQLANVIVSYGGIPIFHRFETTERQIEWANAIECPFVMSMGINDFHRVEAVAETGRLYGVCIDVANGHSLKVIDLVKRLRDLFPDSFLEIIAGNICTGRAAHDLINAGVDAIKVGIGPGAACTTRKRTGFGVPQFTAIQDCAGVAKEFHIPVIADGGIRDSRDVVLALAAGASSVMIGKLFACTEESAASKRHTGCRSNAGERQAKYRGLASASFQEDYYGEVKEGTVPEGEDFWAPVTGSAKQLIDDLIGGIRSGMTYAGARDIEELQRKAKFLQVTPAYMEESGARE
jgi:IMP dehydrogenase